jgi:hypothetical protein
MSSSLSTVAVDGVVYMRVTNTVGGCNGCKGYADPGLCDRITALDGTCLIEGDVIYTPLPPRWLEATEPRCVGVRSFAHGAEVCPQRNGCERFLDLARPVPTNPTYLEMWLCTPERSAFLQVSPTTPKGEAPV